MDDTDEVEDDDEDEADDADSIVTVADTEDWFSGDSLPIVNETSTPISQPSFSSR